MKKPTGLSELGEFGLIRLLTGQVVLRQESTCRGIGDDAAVIDHSGLKTLVTTDLLLEGIHFDLTYVPLKHLGYKSVIVNLSDIYAMNGTPRQITVSIGISSKMTLAAVEELYEGIRLACGFYGVDLIGGDTSASLHGLTISVTALGTAPADGLVYRSGASAGDLICVTGNLGAAYMGLMLLERENRRFREQEGYVPDIEGFPYLLERQLKPEARGDLGRLLEEAGIRATSMIDVSDGLSSDLLHLCEESGTGSVVRLADIPIHPETEAFGRLAGIDPVTAALSGGEDYELLFTVPVSGRERISRVEGIRIIGEMTAGDQGSVLITGDGTSVKMEARGWNASDRWARD